MTPSNASVAAFVVELPADRFVEDLFPALAWTATVRLADPVISSRLVERVLRKAWEEREQFATPELLYQHARHAAHVAIEREAERRFATVRFDDSASMPIPGDLHAMTVQSVQRRLQVMTSVTASPRAVPVGVVPVAATPIAATSVASTPVAAVPAPTATPVNALAAPEQARTFAASVVAIVNDDRATAASPSAQTTSPAPSRTVAKWAAKSSGTSGASSAAAPKASRAPTGMPDRAPLKGSRLHATDSLTHDKGVRMSPRIIGGLAVIVVIALVLVWRSLGSTAVDEQAIAALADTSGVSSVTKPAQQLDVKLPGGGSVHLGPEAMLRSSATFADGARALRLSGPAVVTMAVDSTKPTAIASGTLRWLTYGVSAAFDRVGDQLVVQVDSGALELLGDSTRTRVAAGSSISVSESAIVTALSAAERDAAFAWRTGRLALARQSGPRIAEEVNQWFGLALRFTPALTAAQSLSVNVPLNAVDSLSAALGVAVGGTVERAGQQLTVSAAPPPPVVAAKRVSARRSRSDVTSASRAVARSAARGNTASVNLDDIKLPELKILTPAPKPPR